MKIVYGISNIKKYLGAVVALGVFDGMHCGHRRILKETVTQARKIKGHSVVVTFWPHPQKEASLYSLSHRLKLIAELGVDICIVINFNPAFSRTRPEDFVKGVLVAKIGAQYIYIGKNFKFGRGASGDCRLLKNLARFYHFRLKVFNIIRINHQVVSSTRIRRLISDGKLSAAERLLFKPVSVLGTVVKGDSLARRLGFPTANINPHHEILPPRGIYAVRVIIGKKKLQGVCYIGSRPTISKKILKGRPKNIEVHIFNFKRNIYGRAVEIQFLGKIRKEKKFATHQDLVRQVRIDILHARDKFFLPLAYHNS